MGQSFLVECRVGRACLHRRRRGGCGGGPRRSCCGSRCLFRACYRQSMLMLYSTIQIISILVRFSEWEKVFVVVAANLFLP